MQTYLYGYIALVKPKVIVTLIDNSLPFYFINHRFPKATTIAIQNGRRDNFGRKPNTGFLDLLQIDHGWGKPTISHYCMFGEAEISLLRKYIHANFIATGNLQNNSYPQKPLTQRARPKISFVSSHPNLSHDLSLTAYSQETCTYLGGSAIPYGNYFGIESRAAAIIASIAEKQNCDFQIVAKRPASTPQEKEFFDREMQSVSYEFLVNDDQGSSYQVLTDSDMVVSVDSTIAYEMFGRGKRCLFVSARAESIGIGQIEFNKFASPLNMPSFGPFWSNTTIGVDFEPLFNFALHATNDEWNEATESISSQLVYFDEGNTRIRSLFTSLGLAR
jgi:surface carbohydrate biosynthesis protein